MNKELTRKWHKMDLAEQMGNIGSEFFRAVNLKKRSCFVRCLELIDLSIEDERWRGRVLEICRAREIFCDLFLGKKQYAVSVKSFKKYFLDFSHLIKRSK